MAYSLCSVSNPKMQGRPFKYCNCTQGYEATCGSKFEDMMRCVPDTCLCPDGRIVDVTEEIRLYLTERELKASEKLRKVFLEPS